MRRMSQYLSIGVIICAVISLAIGIAFVQQGFAKESFLVKAMQQEKITVGNIEGIVDTPSEAQIAGDTIREHRHGIAPTYGDLLSTGHFDPTNPTQLSYAQALNLENYLYLAVASFGLFTVVKVNGAFMIIMGFALGGIGIVMLRLIRRSS